MTDYSFPSLGEAVKLVFDCTGLLAQKNSQSKILADETQKKTIQTKLRRLAKEEGDLDKTLDELKNYLFGLICETTQDPRVAEAFMAAVRDIYHSYRETLKDEATYLSKEETVKWLVEYRMVDLVIKSTQKYALMYGVVVSELIFPTDRDWWLPRFNDEKVEWPLETAWRWVYEVTDTSQSRFHNPNDDDGRPKQNLENVSRWFNRDRLPNWGELQNNLEHSIEQMTNCSDERYHRVLDAKAVHSFKIVIFFARMSTDVFKRIAATYGVEFAKNLVVQMRAQNRRLVRFHQNIRKKIEVKLMCKGPLSGLDYYDFWFQEVDDYWRHYAVMLTHDAQAFQNIENESEGKTFSLSELKILRKRFNSFFLAMVLRQRRGRELLTPENRSFMQFYLEGSRLRKQPGLTTSDIEEYQRNLKVAGHDNTLHWLVEWMFATVSCRSEEYETAFHHYKNAFELSKHDGGENTYLLVNQFAESCAKNDKWREFKKLIAWACHHKVQIRGHRGFEESSGAVEYAYNILKLANYTVT